MKLAILNTKAEKAGDAELPAQFSEEFRPDLIKRAVLAKQTHDIQRYGAAPKAGMRASGNLSRRRKKYKSSYGHGISRVPRKIMTARGSRFFWVGAVAPGTVGGRKAHAPKATKCVIKLINATEQAKAMRSALSATVDSKIVQARGHKTPEAYPFILSDDFFSVVFSDVGSMVFPP